MARECFAIAGPTASSQRPSASASTTRFPNAGLRIFSRLKISAIRSNPTADSYTLTVSGCLPNSPPMLQILFALFAAAGHAHAQAHAPAQAPQCEVALD